MSKAEGSVSFEKKLYAGIACLWLGAAPVGYFALKSFSTLDVDRRSLTNRASRALNTVNQLKYDQAKQTSLAMGVVLSARPEYYETYKIVEVDFNSRLDILETLSSGMHTEIQKLRDLRGELLAVSVPGIEERLNGTSFSDTHRFMELNVRLKARAVEDSLNRLYQMYLEEFHENATRVDAEAKRLHHLLILTFFGTALALSMLAIVLIRLTRLKGLSNHYREELLVREKSIAETRKEILETVSHDLKNPLSAIELTFQMLERGAEKADGKFNPKSGIKTGMRATASMRDLIQSLLDQAKINAGSFELHCEKAYLSDVIDDCVSVLSPLAIQKHIDMVVDLQDHPLFAFDKSRVKQVVMNILGNAIKFTPANGRIEVWLEADSNFAKVRIRDSGPGIREQDLEHVFERFWQAKSTASFGTGLGLSIAHAIVKEHGGAIFVRNANQSTGAEFEFQLPLNPTKPRSLRSPELRS